MESSVPVTLPHSLLDSLARNWWLLAIRGLLLIVLGMYALLQPGMTLVVFCYVMGAFLAADGILAILAGATGWVRSRTWTALRGLLILLVGLGIMAWPALIGSVAALTLVYFIAAGLVVGGGLQIAAAIQQRKSIEGEGWIILDGVLTLLFGVVLILMPLLAAGALIMVAGIAAVVFGGTAVSTAFRLKKLNSPGSSPAAPAA